jgi:NADH-quinone oxidoreductase subunit L
MSANVPIKAIGYLTIEPMLFKGWLDEAITVTSSHVSMVELKQQFHGALGMISHALQTLPFWMMVVRLKVERTQIAHCVL